MQSPQSILILQNTARPFAEKTAKLVAAIARAEGVLTATLPTTGRSVGETPDIPAGAADLIIACGGDGTIIEAAHRSRGSKIPIAGINAGYLGFLSAFSGRNTHALRQGTKKILAGKFSVEHRATIETLGQWAVNDIVILSQEKSSLISLQLKIGKTAATEYYGDGLIIATPTGSTAYSLAAGGPVLTQGNRALVITPICPHSFANRSVIVSENETIEIICPKGTRAKPAVSCDGQTQNLEAGTRLSIQVSKTDFPLVSMKTTNRYEILVEKLGWRPLPK